MIASDSGLDYNQWLVTVPLQERKRMAALLRKYQISEYGDLVSFSKDIICELIEGNITPLISREVRAWAELMFTIIATANTDAGTPEAAQNDIMMALIQVQKQITRKDVIEVEPVKERMKIEAM